MDDKAFDPTANIDPSVLARLKAHVCSIRDAPGPSVRINVLVRILEITLRMRPAAEDEVFELGKWNTAPWGKVEIKAEKDRLVRVLLGHGWSVTDAVQRAEMIWQRPGRPVTKRLLALPALDMWLTNPQKSWMQVTREVCNCGKPSHDFRCKDQLMGQVKDLKNVLKRFRVPIPPRSRAADPLL